MKSVKGLVIVLLCVCAATSFGMTVLIDSSRSQSYNTATIEFFDNNFQDTSVIYGNYTNTSDPGVQAAIEAADVFVIARGNSSSNYTAADTTYYSGLSIPVICLSSYFSRASNLNWEAGAVTMGSMVDNEATVTTTGAAVFGTAGDFDWWSGSSDFWGVGNDPAVGSGAILAMMGGYNLVVGWNAGDTVNTGELQSGSRLLFNLPDGNLLPDTVAGQQAMIDAIVAYTDLVAIPEPATMAILGLGTLLIRRKR